MKKIKLNKNQVALVDDEDFDELVKFKWYVGTDRGEYYARRYVSRTEKISTTTVSMHRQVMGFPKSKMIDHINRNTLDNRKCNLRTCTNSQNNQNRIPNKNGTSKYKGVYWSEDRKKWCACLKYKNKGYNLGRFADEIEAAKAYDEKAKELFGEFAYLNFRKAK